jgi:hypothetical protein
VSFIVVLLLLLTNNRAILARKKTSGDERELHGFFLQYGAKEACAMCLILTSAPPEPPALAAPVGLLEDSKYSTPRPPVSTSRADIASPSYFEAATMSGEELARLARQAFFRFGSEEQPEEKCIPTTS